MTTSNLVDERGRPVVLGGKLGTGGEGAVYEVAGIPDLVAKVYHKSPPASHAEKLRSMVTLARKELCTIAAWPTAVLSERPGGAVVGLVMRKVKDYKEVHALYSPAQRKVTYPDADWKFLIHVASNCAAAFHIVHSHGVVVGDVNQSNIMVSKTGEIVFIDCDSFQIQDAGRTYPCEVGVPLFTPPELIDHSFRGLVRSANHDRFGLAVLVFHLLMMGRHPFSGRYSGSGDMPIDQAIKGFRFAYGGLAHRNLMQPPLHALPLSALSPRLGVLFERAFDDQSPTAGRPTPAEWFEALKEFRASVRKCPREPGHQTPSHLSECIWCELMKQGAPNFFISVAFAATSGSTPTQVFVLGSVWSRIDAVPRPAFGPLRHSRQSARAPTPWPATVPLIVPPKPIMPTILTSPQVPPNPVLPQARYAKTVFPYTSLQRTAGYIVLGCASLFLPCLMFGFIFGQALALKPAMAARVLGGADLVVLFAASIWWLVLERTRRRVQAQANRLYKAEQQELQDLAEEQYAAWRRTLDGKVKATNRQHQVAKRNWDQTVSLIQQEVDRRRAAARAATAAVENAESSWAMRTAQFGAEFDRKKNELSVLRNRHTELSGQLAADRQRLAARAIEIQRTGYLQQYFVKDAAIPDIGPTRKATLASFGIETADDVTEDAIRAIPRFGEKLTSRLLAWRAEVEATFRFNPAVGIPDHEQRALEFRYFQQRQPVEVGLTDGEKQLAEITHRARVEFQSLQQRIGSLLEAVEQATADLLVIPVGI